MVRLWYRVLKEYSLFCRIDTFHKIDNIEDLPNAEHSIHVRQQYHHNQEQAMIHAVHSALLTAFQLPKNDRLIRFFVHEPDHFAYPLHLSKPEYFTLIEIDCFVGRTIATKRELYQQIVRNLGALDIPADHISILIRESTLENWGIRGGQAASDIDLGFQIRI